MGDRLSDSDFCSPHHRGEPDRKGYRGEEIQKPLALISLRRKERKRSEWRKDDILPKLMACSGSQLEDLYKKEKSKYDKICYEMNQIIEAQELQLLQIQVQNEEASAVLEDYKSSREESCTQISSAIAKYREIKENINEGLKFYILLQDAITKVQQQCDDFIMTRNIQSQEMIENLQKQMSDLNFSDGNVGSDYPSAELPNLPTYAPHLYPSYATAQQTPNHGQLRPAYHSWPGPYYNASQLQQGPLPPPPQTILPPFQGSHNGPK